MSHIAICVPTEGLVEAGFAFDLAKAVGWHGINHPEDVIHLTSMSGSILSAQRQGMMKEAIENGADFVIQIDSDMRFPPQTFAQLVGHDEPFVAANCSKRRLPLGPTAFRVGDGELEPVMPNPEVNGLEEVYVVGFGVACIRKDVFLQIAWPWVDNPWLDQEQHHMGEDTFFCKRLRDAEIPVLIDHGLSWHIRHCGTVGFGMPDLLGMPNGS